MSELDRDTVLQDLQRIAAWLAEDIDNDEAQGAASDLNVTVEWITQNTEAK